MPASLKLGCVHDATSDGLNMLLLVLCKIRCATCCFGVFMMQRVNMAGISESGVFEMLFCALKQSNFSGMGGISVSHLQRRLVANQFDP
jgi:hypothetical protein